jgi:hypothetical protein
VYREVAVMTSSGVRGISPRAGSKPDDRGEGPELGRLIGQSPEYQTLRRAEKTLQEDAETRTGSKDRSAGAADRRTGGPEEDSRRADRDRLRTGGSRPRGEHPGQAYVIARANYEKLMTKVNQQMSLGIERGATSSIITLA